MDFSNWLLITETQKIINKSNDNFKDLLIEIFETKGNLERYLEEEMPEMPEDIPDPDPFAGGDENAKPIEERKRRSQAEIRAILANQKLLKSLDIDDQENRKIIISILVELGYLEPEEEGEKLLVKKSQVDRAYRQAMRDIKKKEKEEEIKRRRRVEFIDEETREQTLKEIKDAMLRLRFKGMEFRKNKIDELKNLDVKNPQDTDRCFRLLSDLNYVGKEKDEVDIEELEKSYNAAVSEQDNSEAPAEIAGEIQGKSVEQLRKEFQEKFAELWTKKMLPLPEGTEFLERLTNSLHQRFVSKEKNASPWSWTWLPPRSPQYLDPSSNISLKQILSITNRIQKNKKIDDIRNSKEYSFGQTQGNADEVEDFITGHSRELGKATASDQSDEFALGKEEASAALVKHLKDFKLQNPLQGYTFCVLFGLNCDDLDNFNFEPLSRAHGAMISQKVKEKLIEIFSSDPINKDKVEKMDQSQINKLIRDSKKSFAKIVCSDPLLKDSHYSRLLGCEDENPLLAAKKPTFKQTTRRGIKMQGRCSKCGAIQTTNDEKMQTGRAICNTCKLGRIDPIT